MVFRYLAVCKYCGCEEEICLEDVQTVTLWGKDITSVWIPAIEGVCPDCQDKILNKMEESLIGG